MKSLRHWLCPDEFAARQWRALFRRAGWLTSIGPLIIVCSGVTAGLVWLLAGRFGISPDFATIMLVVAHQVLNVVAPFLAAVVLWRRIVDRQLFRDLAVTPLDPVHWLESTFLPARMVLAGFGILIAVATVVYWVVWGAGERDVRVIMVTTVPLNVAQSLWNLRLAVAMIAVWGLNVRTAIALASVLIAVQTLTVVLCGMVVGVELIDSSEGYVTLLALFAVLHFVLFRWIVHKFPAAARRGLERIALAE